VRIDVLGGLRRNTQRFPGIFPQKHKRSDEMGNPAPLYASLSDEKSTPQRPKYIPIVIPSQETSGLASSFPLEHRERQASVQELPTNQTLFVVNPDTPHTPHTPPPNPQQHPISFYPPQPTRQPSVVYNLNKRASDLSTLSSLSSGFGDAKIDVPESGPSTMNAQPKSIGSRASRNSIASRFSWAASWQLQPPSPRQSRSQNIHYTVNTIMSEESTPRFRSVNSWVNQQMSRIERQRTTSRKVDTMPDIPVLEAARKSQHVRIPSGATDPAFQHHPGQELSMSHVSRVPSSTLDENSMNVQ
jgi:hypothetical protein